MLFRSKDGNLIDIKRSNYSNDKQYYLTIINYKFDNYNKL